jgi:hypothetical protein
LEIDGAEKQNQSQFLSCQIRRTDFNDSDDHTLHAKWARPETRRESRSFRAVAKAFGLSVNPIRHAIRKLEAALAVPLPAGSAARSPTPRTVKRQPGPEFRQISPVFLKTFAIGSNLIGS